MTQKRFTMAINSVARKKKLKNDKTEGVTFILKNGLKHIGYTQQKNSLQFPILRSVSTYNLRLEQG